nr:hAT transposon superfamily protein [Tanacetum cinerariifolium]
MASVDSNLDGAVPTTTTKGNSCTDLVLKRNSGDLGWNYGTLCDATNKDAIKCTLSICKKASEEDKTVYSTSLENPKEKKKEKRIREEKIREEVEIEDEDNDFNDGSKRQNPKNLGPMDKFVNPIDPEGVTLKEEVERTKGLLKKQEEEWAQNGCSGCYSKEMIIEITYACDCVGKLNKLMHMSGARMVISCKKAFQAGLVGCYIIGDDKLLMDVA